MVSPPCCVVSWGPSSLSDTSRLYCFCCQGKNLGIKTLPYLQLKEYRSVDRLYPLPVISVQQMALLTILWNCSYFLKPLIIYMFDMLSIIMSVREKPVSEFLLNGWFNCITRFAFGMEEKKKMTTTRVLTQRAHVLVEGAESKCFGNTWYAVSHVNRFWHLDSLS